MSRLQSRIANRLKLTVNKYLNETCDISRIDFVQSRVGQVEAPVIVASDVSCRVIDDSRTTGQGYQQTGDHYANVDAYRVILPAGQTVDIDYRITVGTRRYDVVDLLDDRSNELFVECRVRRVRGNDS